MDGPSRYGFARRGAVALLTTATVAVVLAGSARAEEIGTTEGKLEAGSVAILGYCTAGGPKPVITLTKYQNGEYRLVGVNVINIGTVEQACRSQPYTLGVADNLGSLPLIAEWTGTLPNGPKGPLEITPFTDGANLEVLNSTNNQVQVFVVTWRS